MKHTEFSVIREALSDDVNGIIEVLKTSYLQDEAWARKALEKLLATENYVILVAELHRKIVGFIDYYILPSVWEKWNEATINYLFIHKDYQGRGIGSKLLKEVIKQTDKMGIMELHVGTEKENKRAIHLYKKHGFLKEYLLLEREKEQK
ncbi:MAG: GNAT family N-acetyltransferase [Candidatus Bathyarchaeota archaeon]|nr:GNAT family N-acetyltransferase [Candidatus Bathyarchaeota archaeon]